MRLPRMNSKELSGVHALPFPSTSRSRNLPDDVSASSTRSGSRKQPSAAASMPASRKVGFTVLALFLPFLLLALLEGGLRLAGYGAHPALIKPVEGYPGYLQPDESVSARYFTSIENLPSIPFDWVTEPKADSTFRIVIQGGSTAAGWPYYFAADFGDVVEHHLQQLHPEFRFEVLNTSMAAVNSYTLLDLSGEIMDLEPDAVLIYAGHNEYYGALGVGSSQGFGSSPAVINLYLSLRPFRIVQLLQQGISGVMGLFTDVPSGSAPGQTLMQNMVKEQRIPLGSDLYNRGLDQFRFNLDILLARYAEAGIPVYIGTLASNIQDQVPFIAGVSRKGAAVSEDRAREWTGRAARLLAGGQAAEALASVDSLIALEDGYATAHFIRGRALERLGRLDEASESYLNAKDRDELRFRAPEAFNDIIRELAEKHGAIIVESRQAFVEASPDGLIGKEMMLEHLHPTVSGYRTLGNAFFMGMAGTQFGSGRGLRWAWDQALRESLRPTPVPSIDSLSGAYRVQQLTSSWPFQPPGSRMTRIDTLMPGTVAGNLALRLFQDDVPRIEALDALRTDAIRKGDLETADLALQSIIQSYPMVPGPHLALAKIRMQQGRLEEAEVLARRELSMADHAEAFQILGTLLLNRRQTDAAIPLLERAVAMNPADLRARYNLAGAYALRQRFDDARQQAGEILRRNPGAADAQRLLDSLPR